MVLLCFSLLFMAGVYLVYSEEFITVPKTTLQAVAKEKNFSFEKKYELYMGKLSHILLRLVKVSEYKAEELERMLRSLGRTESANAYTAQNIAASLVYCIIGALLYPFSPTVFLMLILLSCYLYYKKTTSLKKKYIARREQIEMDLPKLCSVINSRLRSTQNVSAILQGFLSIASPAMAEEITITLTDMRTGNTELALRRFEQRANSSKVSDIIRGLISVNNGDEQSVYFQSKQYQFNNDYMTLKKKHITKRPLKLSLPGMVAFLFFLMILMYPLLEGAGSLTQVLF